MTAPKNDQEQIWVVRGGLATPEQLQDGVGNHRSVPHLSGFSVQSQPGATIQQLAEAGRFANAHISFSTVERLRQAAQAAGYEVRVVKSPGYGLHATVEVPNPLPQKLAEALSLVFTHIPNPARIKR